MVDARSFVPTAVTALVSAGLVEASRRDEAERIVLSALAPSEKRVSSRALLVEIAGYLGGALVVASFGLFLAQYWTAFSDTAQVAALSTIAVLLAVGGLAVCRVGSGYGELREGRAEVRRRLAAALLTAAAAAAGIAVGRLTALHVGEEVGDEGWPIVAGALTALVLAAAAYAYASSVLGQFAMAGASLMTVMGAWTLLDENQTDTLWPGVALMAVGTLWLVCAECGVFREVVQARAIGAGLTLFGAQFTLFSGDHNNLSYLLIALVAVAAFVMYLRRLSWPYLVVGVLGVTLVVPEAVIDWAGGSLGPAGGVLVAGVTLLGASVAGLRVRQGVTDEKEQASAARPHLGP